MHTSNTENREHDFKPNGFGSDHCLVCGGKVSEHTVDGREQTFEVVTRFDKTGEIHKIEYSIDGGETFHLTLRSAVENVINPQKEGE